ncbi:unnamed protein product [Paramecium sonneborni]|uniref:Uncharacterized protein n=1 Tax=Paramecium sonneborni TaxID=65129 RepID=A0A8S1RP89_9CILI|nr:unnamed protein product [Paramecium sonneborni]
MISSVPINLVETKKKDLNANNIYRKNKQNQRFQKTIKQEKMKWQIYQCLTFFLDIRGGRCSAIKHPQEKIKDQTNIKCGKSSTFSDKQIKMKYFYHYTGFRIKKNIFTFLCNNDQLILILIDLEEKELGITILCGLTSSISELSPNPELIDALIEAVKQLGYYVQKIDNGFE